MARGEGGVQRQSADASNEFTTPHGRVTKPLRMA
jgi:hypothetical protein